MSGQYYNSLTTWFTAISDQYAWSFKILVSSYIVTGRVHQPFLHTGPTVT
jgi:hypothetical protein